jgi:2-oxoacid:acceptor oxidoreductase gamma subunit (pyruvate/2-ketoisovalerate family)
MKRIKFYGLGGQGVVTAAKVLSTAVSIHEDKYAITVPAYGHERRGAPVYTDIVVDEKPILVNCFVYEPDIVLVMDETIIEKNVDVSKGKHENTILVLNTSDIETAKMYAEKYDFRKVYYVDGTQVALDNIGRGIPNGSMLGALAHTGIVSIASVESALKEIFGVKAGDKNANSARAAYEQTKEL